MHRQIRWQLHLSIIVGVMLLLGAALAITEAAQPKQATFEITNIYTVKVPTQAQTMRIWFAVPQEDAESTIKNFDVEAPYEVRYHADSQGNRVGYVEIQDPKGEEITIRETFAITRREILGNIDPAQTRPLTEAEKTAMAEELKSSTYVPVNDEMKALAAQIVGDEDNPIKVARKLYDWTLDNIDYWVKDPEHLKASSVGSTEYCLRTKTGNCTDFHSLYTSLARAAGLPSRIVYGSLLKPTLNGMDVDASYHCWVQFYAPNLDWLTLDVAVADIYVSGVEVNEKNAKLMELTTATGYQGADAKMVNYYFGNLDERRVVWSVGRDLTMAPAQEAGPVNALTKMYVEVDGKVYNDWSRKFTYKEVRAN
jgi:transglutaminase-like putative cysteine protease